MWNEKRAFIISKEIIMIIQKQIVVLNFFNKLSFDLLLHW